MQGFSDCLWMGFLILTYCDLLKKSWFSNYQRPLILTTLWYTKWIVFCLKVTKLEGKFEKQLKSRNAEVNTMAKFSFWRSFYADKNLFNFLKNHFHFQGYSIRRTYFYLDIFKPFIFWTTTGPPLVRSPLVRIPLVRFLVL